MTNDSPALPKYPVWLVTATRLCEHDFWQKSMLGQSLQLFRKELLPELLIRFDNTGPGALGLPAIYNAATDHAMGHSLARNRTDAIVFIHDDVWIHDGFFCERILEALEHNEVVGVAGSESSNLESPSWALEFDSNLVFQSWQDPLVTLFAGAVAHHVGWRPELGTPKSTPNVYGPPKQNVHLLDGVLIASSVATVAHVRFDERFRFHCYDLDFCRRAREEGYHASTWPLAITHASGGAFETEDFRQEARVYLDKWSARGKPERSVPAPSVVTPCPVPTEGSGSGVHGSSPNKAGSGSGSNPKPQTPNRPSEATEAAE